MSLRLRYVAGVSPAKWLRAWADRRPDLPLEATRVNEDSQLVEVRAGDADLAFVRLPVDDDELHVIPLWEEVAVAVLPKDHAFADAESLALADLADEPRAPEQEDPAMTIELVAAGTGWAMMPHGVARLHHRRDVVAVPVADAPTTRIALVWRVARDDEDIQEFVGVVRGRTARSSRSGGQADATGSGGDARADRRARDARGAGGGSGRTSHGRRGAGAGGARRAGGQGRRKGGKRR
ncbi:LysR family substrate-binding domain-containing protein [Agromyces kandeliae]|uniref:LysR family transcriptional regulator n=1 Tax=Agromyces kandeliae TaxID=2666141 RepID=A0A6L5R2Y9_9MICO|nr:LysR family substrate-binding domain-containing protein [Agromyces kandeliae]MRX44350.1 LysR family transcriptional regulator [Agromyces kandeliae]